MLITFDRSKLLDRAALALQLIPARPQHPVASYFKLSILDPEMCSLEATDFTSWIAVKIPCRIEANWGSAGFQPHLARAFLLPARLLLQSLRALHGDEIELAFEEKTTECTKTIHIHAVTHGVHVGDNACWLALPDYKIIDYPALQDTIEKAEKSETDSDFVLPAEALAEGLLAVGDFSSKDQTKQVLQGIHLSYSQEGLKMTATDGHRAALWQKPIDAKEKIKIQGSSTACTLFADFCLLLEKCCRYFENEIDLQVSSFESCLVFQAESFQVASRQIGGMFPNVEDMFVATMDQTKDTLTEAIFDKNSLLQALEIASVCADSRMPRVALCYSGEIASRSDKGVAVASATVVGTASPGNHTISLNLAYLKNALKSLMGREVKVRQGITKYVILTSADNGEGECSSRCQYLLAPIIDLDRDLE